MPPAEPGHSCADRQGVWAIGGTHGASTVTLVSNRGAIHVTTLPWRAQRLWALEAGVLIEAERSTPRVAGETGLLYLSHPLDPPRPLRIESGDWDGTVLLTSRTAPPLLLSHSPRLGAHVAWALATEGGEGEDGAVLLRCVWSEPAPAPASDAFLFAASSACVLLCLVLPERGGGGAALAQVHRVALPAGHAGAPSLPSRPCGAVAAVAARPVACPADTPPRLRDGRCERYARCTRCEAGDARPGLCCAGRRPSRLSHAAPTPHRRFPHARGTRPSRGCTAAAP